jgi:hypothetical protein
MVRRFGSATFLTLGLVGACHEAREPITVPATDADRAVHGAPAPAPSVTVSAAGSSLTFWPYTGTDFSSDPSDPVNLIFVGEADPRSIRAALFGLNGDRTAFGYPPAFPFDCTWADAIGAEQTAFSEGGGWEGSIIQLECGTYDPVRFHLRLFSAGNWTLANAHVDVLIPGTTDHQVLSWEVAEQLVTVDLVRSGLLAAPPAPTAPIHQAPFRTIPAIIYNGLPAGLKQLAVDPTGVIPAPASVANPVPILTDGRATLLHLGQAAAVTEGVAAQQFVLQFNQVIPKPFCGAAPVLVQGPVELSQDVRVVPSGNLTRRFRAHGTLSVTPIDPATGQPAGPASIARIQDQTHARLTDHLRSLDFSRVQHLESPNGPPERLQVDLKVGPHGLTRFSRNERCG